jgi:RES domain
MVPVVLYDWAHPQQQLFTQLTKLLRRRSELNRRFLAYHTQYHVELALQRREKKVEIAEALSRSCLSPFPFSRWQRTIRWRYSDHPLCTIGSLALGGRFNIGTNIDPALFPPFSAFYAAADKTTALQEALGQEAADAKLDAEELALADPASVLTFSISGRLDHVLDLRDPASLRDFVRVIKNFKLSPALRKLGSGLPVVPPSVIQTVKALKDSLLTPHWRHVQTLCEIPANGQIFGQIVAQAGIEGILYPSKLSGGDCLAIFPANFRAGASFIQLDDDPPEHLVGPRRIDATNWEMCERAPGDLRPRTP